MSALEAGIAIVWGAALAYLAIGLVRAARREARVPKTKRSRPGSQRVEIPPHRLSDDRGAAGDTTPDDRQTPTSPGPP